MGQYAPLAAGSAYTHIGYYFPNRLGRNAPIDDGSAYTHYAMTFPWRMGHHPHSDSGFVDTHAQFEVARLTQLRKPADTIRREMATAADLSVHW